MKDIADAIEKAEMYVKQCEQECDLCEDEYEQAKLHCQEAYSRLDNLRKAAND